jgi:hypothetical protein
MKPFLIHVFVKRRQAQKMEELKASADTEKIVLQVDFSENASLQDQNEIQSMHWSHKQATLFTAFAWVNTIHETKESMVIVSDELPYQSICVYLRNNQRDGHLF